MKDYIKSVFNRLLIVIFMIIVSPFLIIYGAIIVIPRFIIYVTNTVENKPSKKYYY